MRLHTKTTQFILAAFLFCATFAGFAQDQNANQPKPDPSLQSNQPVKNDSHCVVQGDNPGSPTDTQCVPGFRKAEHPTTMVLVSGKGERPFSEPLGAADVAPQFVKAVKAWREEKKASGK
jgi:hypothetical protein